MCKGAPEVVIAPIGRFIVPRSRRWFAVDVVVVFTCVDVRAIHLLGACVCVCGVWVCQGI